MNNTGLETEIARLIWSQRYRHGGSAEPDIAATWRRVANALAQAEPAGREDWAARFRQLLEGFRFLPGGRVLAGAGTPRRVTLLNCFVMGGIEDSIPGIFRALQEGAVTMQEGGGVGYDFSTLRPRGLPASIAGNIASGPVSFMAVWDAMCATIQSTGARRGAMMATLRCDHPDIEAFIAAKSQHGVLSHFNLSVLVTDSFMRAAAEGATWPLIFPATPPHRVTREVNAAELWDRLMRASFASAEPGVLFIDQINRMNNLHYCERISAVNPCGEVPLPHYGGCDLGSLNLTAFIRAPFSPSARLDTEALLEAVPIAVRMLDNVLDVSHFPLPAQAEEVRAKRRVGLGITGLADALIMLGLDYGAEAARHWAGGVMRAICHAAYRASTALAAEKGAFPAFARDAYLAGPFIRALPEDIRDAIAVHGIRNSHLLAIAPTGTISLLAGNVSSGIEPVFAAEADRTILDAFGAPQHVQVMDHAVRLWRQEQGGGLPPAFTDAGALPVQAHLGMQAALQAHVDQSIAKTINLPGTCSFADFADTFRAAHALGLKGCTVFRPQAAAGVLSARE
ncbi:MAG: adenosylcobalamin-dependent ribonucleoside-diphosphate reductase [Acidocella sp.]|nr:adenosylcobalamin-dependent ribonucleoside-diphosphate reductase [Acidocella sp.]MDR3717650.1 adenosylcobalamin-dependent ribonucleoside-diphosphate reductase [Bryobacteraceae bacterium]